MDDLAGATPLLEPVGDVPIELEPFVSAVFAEPGQRVVGGSNGSPPEAGRLGVVYQLGTGRVMLEVTDAARRVQARAFLSAAAATRLSALLQGHQEG